jgi:integrase
MIAADYRHGLRVSELVDLRWAQVDFVTANLHVRRVCVPNIRFGMDAENRRGKLAT